MLRRRSFAMALGAAPFAASSRLARAATYPERPISILVGFPPGQASDIGARVIAARMGEELRQTVIVDNKAGAMGIISHQFVKTAPPDGYTVLYGSSGTLAINPGLYRKLSYDPLKDFQPVILLNSSPMFLVCSNDTPVRNLKEMTAYARANPGKVSYGSSGNGATQHIAMEMLKKEAGIDMLHVPYKGSPPMVTDLIAGRMQFAFDVSTSSRRRNLRASSSSRSRNGARPSQRQARRWTDPRSLNVGGAMPATLRYLSRKTKDRIDIRISASNARCLARRCVAKFAEHRSSMCATSRRPVPTAMLLKAGNGEPDPLQIDGMGGTPRRIRGGPDRTDDAS